MKKTIEVMKKECSLLPGYNCNKMQVLAMIKTVNGVSFGINNIKVQQTLCPRDAKGFKSGEGYHLCITDCNKGEEHEHAEVSAINNAKKQNLNLKGSTLFLHGHTYCCDNCTKEMVKEGISKVVICNDNGAKKIILL